MSAVITNPEVPLFLCLGDLIYVGRVCVKALAGLDVNSVRWIRTKMKCRICCSDLCCSAQRLLNYSQCAEVFPWSGAYCTLVAVLLHQYFCSHTLIKKQVSAFTCAFMFSPRACKTSPLSLGSKPMAVFIGVVNRVGADCPQLHMNGFPGACQC